MKLLKTLTTILLCVIFILSGCSEPGDITDETNKAIETTAPQYEYNYIGNVNTKVFHATSCSSLPEDENRIYFDSREKALYWNFSPCKKCNP